MQRMADDPRKVRMIPIIVSMVVRGGPYVISIPAARTMTEIINPTTVNRSNHFVMVSNLISLRYIIAFSFP